MKRRPRNYCSASQRALVWDRWRQGVTLHQIAALFDRHRSSIQHILAATGGIRPASRKRSEAAHSLAVSVSSGHEPSAAGARRMSVSAVLRPTSPASATGRKRS